MTQITRAVNEPILSFAAESTERASLKAKYDEMATQTIEIPLIIDGKEIKTGDIAVVDIGIDNKIKILLDRQEEQPEKLEKDPV